MKRLFSLLVILVLALSACGVAPDPVVGVEDVIPVEDVVDGVIDETEDTTDETEDVTDGVEDDSDGTDITDEESVDGEPTDGSSEDVPLVCEGINYNDLFKEMRRIVTVNNPKLIELFFSGNFEELEKFVLAKEGDMAKFREIVQLIRTCSTL